MTDLPDPLTPPFGDLRNFPFTPLFRSRLFGSRFHARTTDAEWRAGLTLWLKSWDQVPAGSLPEDDIDLCRLAELGRDLAQWMVVKTMALHGWMLCSDGLLYHPVVAEGVNEALSKKQKQSKRGKAGAEAKWLKHQTAMQQASVSDGTNRKSDSVSRSLPMQTDAQPMLSDGNREGDRERKKETSLREVKKGTRIPESWELTEPLRAYAVLHGVDPEKAAHEFINYWLSRTKDATKLNWDRTFENRILELQDQGKFRLQHGHANGQLPLNHVVEPTAANPEGRLPSPMSGTW